MPVRLFITTRAGASAGVNSKFSSVAKKPTRCPTSRGAETRTEAASMGVAITYPLSGCAPKRSLIVSARAFAVEKSGRCKFSVSESPFAKPLGTDCSTIAPLGIRPTVGVLTTIRDPSPPCAPKPLTTKLPCATAYTFPSTPFKKV